MDFVFQADCQVLNTRETTGPGDVTPPPQAAAQGEPSFEMSQANVTNWEGRKHPGWGVMSGC